MTTTTTTTILWSKQAAAAVVQAATASTHSGVAHRHKLTAVQATHSGVAHRHKLTTMQAVVQDSVGTTQVPANGNGCRWCELGVVTLHGLDHHAHSRLQRNFPLGCAMGPSRGTRTQSRPPHTSHVSARQAVASTDNVRVRTRARAGARAHTHTHTRTHARIHCCQRGSPPPPLSAQVAWERRRRRRRDSRE
jgi:hypothetical protein